MSTHAPHSADRLAGRRRPATPTPGRVPAEAALRRTLRDSATRAAASLNGDGPPARDHLAALADGVLADLDLPADYLGFAMVLLANAYWADRLAAVPYRRRLLLLPRCLSAGTDGTDPATIRRRAERLGYRTLIADGTPIVVKTLAAEPIEAVVGVACLDSLAAVFDKIRRLGAPAVAVPLLAGTCKDTTADLGWLDDYLRAHRPAAPASPSYLAALRLADRICRPPRLDPLLDGLETTGHGEALDATGRIGRDWLASGGKRLRPLVTLAAAAAVSGAEVDALDDATARAALAVEAFHKASLAHDDIEDDDDRRYGRPTLHRVHGTAAAINVGDYLLGLGYQLLAAAGRERSADVAAALLGHLSRAHLHLARGQGAELAWRREGAPLPAVGEVLKVYALKTAPAFAAALAAGIVLGGGPAQMPAPLHRFTRHVGVAFQVLNDLNDWAEDLRRGRRTYLTALATASADPNARDDLAALLEAARTDPAAVDAVAIRFEDAGVFRTANRMVDEMASRAAAAVEGVDPPALRRLCVVLIDLILN
ncbi:MAG: polyprenyl synthetase family protein [Planctomycetota bacterium]